MFTVVITSPDISGVGFCAFSVTDGKMKPRTVSPLESLQTWFSSLFDFEVDEMFNYISDMSKGRLIGLKSLVLVC